MEIDKREVQMPTLLNKAIHQFDDNLYAKRMYYIIQSQMVKGFGLQLDLYNNYWLQIPTSLVGTQNFERLDRATDVLQNARFKFVDAKLEHFNKITPFPEVHYQKGWGHIKVKISQGAIPYLAELSNGYYMAKLRSMLTTKGKYTQRWYELFSDKVTFTQPLSLTIEKIIELHGIQEGDFSRNTSMLRKVVYEPIEELNEKTELFVGYAPLHNQKKPILGFDFEITTQQARGEAEAIKKIDEYYQSYTNSSGKDKYNMMIKIGQLYQINHRIINKIVFEERIVNEVVRIHLAIENKKIVPQKGATEYIGGTIAKLMKEHGIKI